MERDDKILALCLGAIAAIGPLAMDMYLAAMPTMAAQLNAGHGEIEMSVMAFFIGFCLGQLVLGPVSDRTGRKPVVFLGLSVFAISSLGCMLSGSIPELMGWRFAQGIGGSIGMVIAMSSVRDRFRGAQAAQMMGMVVIVLGMAPVIAPILGGAILMVAPWQVIFVVLALAALGVLTLVWKMMPEPRSAEMRKNSHPLRAPGTYARLLVDRTFIPYAGAMALTQGGFFGYISAASVVLITGYGVAPIVFSVIFAVNAIGMTICARTGGALVGRIGAVKLARIATVFRACLALVMLALSLAGALTLPVFLVVMFFLIASLGFVMPSVSVLALDAQGQNAGAASALMGAAGFGAGALVSLVIGLLADGSAWPIALTMAASAVLAALLAVFAFDDNAGISPAVAEKGTA